MGVQGPYTDMFFFNVLLNRREVAEAMWRQVQHPVRTAMTAAFMLRKMASVQSIEASTMDRLYENADYFEDLGDACTSGHGSSG